MTYTHLLRCLLLMLLVALLTGCESVRISYGEATYTRTALFTDKQIEDVSLSKDGDDVTVDIGKANGQARLEALEVLRGIMEVAR